MPQLYHAQPTRLAAYFTEYLHTRNGGAHVRRVAPWIGFIVMGMVRLKPTDWHVSNKRQLMFELHSKWYKIRYNHQAAYRGGIEILRVLPGPGNPDGPTITVIKSLQDAEKLYRACRRKQWPPTP